MDPNKELDDLNQLMRSYDKELKEKRNREFKANFFNRKKNFCMPLTSEELYIYRCLTGVIPGVSKKDIAKTLEVKEDTLNKKILIIRGVLRVYFYDVHVRRRYNKTVNASNENITIFDLGLSINSINNLRVLKCYYLKDITTAREDDIRAMVSDVDYLKILLAMQEHGMKYDGTVYRLKKAKVTRLN